MGEIAESMLSGEMCEGCGIYLECDECENNGIPAYCSPECAKNRGGLYGQICRHSETEKLNPELGDFEVVDIELGTLYGYELILKDVPAELSDKIGEEAVKFLKKIIKNKR